MIGSIGCAFKRVMRCVSVLQWGLVLAVSATAASAATVSAGTTPMVFSNAQVGVVSGSAQTLTETFTLTGYTSVVSPTATMHYGLAYKIGAVACTGGVGSQTCTVSVTFQPKQPGGHRDAVFLMDGETRIASVLVYGVGVSPLALLQPGIVTQSADQGTYLYTSIVAEDGTAYIVAEEGSKIFSRSTAGVITALPITGLNSPRGIGIDGAGLLYIADQTSLGSIKTYDTVTGTQGTFPFPLPNPGTIQTMTVGNTGTVYEEDYGNIYVFAPGVAEVTIPINPSITQPSAITVDSAGNLFVAGYSVNELTAGGTQSQINAAYPIGSVYTDAADTLYTNGLGRGLSEFAASDYTTSEGLADASGSALGGSVALDGTVYVGDYSVLDVVDRSQGAIDFGSQTSGTQTVQLYNGGNAKLTIAGIALAGPSEYSTAQPAAPCTANLVLDPGGLCNLTVNFLTTVPGRFNGAVTFTTNSLNTTSTSVVTLTAAVSGAYMVPSPTSLDFGSVAEGTTSATRTITLTNDGYGVAAQVYSPGSSNPAFTVTLGTCNVNIAVGASCALNVTFSPTAGQKYSATGSAGVTNVGPGGAPPVSFTLGGTGTAVAQVTVSPASINFGDQTENTYSFSPVKVSIVNNSNSNVNVGPLAFSKNFGLYQDNCGGVAPANSSSCYYLVDFYPTSVGPQTGTLSIPYTGAGGGTLTVSLQGNGTAGTPLLSINPPLANFPTAPLMTAATPIVLKVENTGSAGTTAITTKITGANAADFSETNNCTTLPEGSQGVGGSCTVTVNFTPSAAGPRTATITVSANGADGGSSTASAPLSGAGIAQPSQLQFTPTQLNLIAGVGGPCSDATSGTASAATLCNITGTTQDYLGNTYLVDNTYNVVYKVDTAGTLSIFAGTPSKTGGYTGDSGPATSATLSGPTAVAADAFGNIFISDTANSAIREVDTTGMITSFIDGTCHNNGKGTPQNGKTSVPAAKGRRHSLDLCETFKPEGLVVDAFDNLIFADTLNNVVLETNITLQNFGIVAGKTPDMYTFTGTAGYNGDNVQAATAELNAPQDVAVDAAGNIYIADTLNNRVRRVDVTTRIITTVAGNGTQGDTGDGAAATDAEISPYGISADLAGDLFITPGAGGIVRKVDAAGTISAFAGNGTGAIGGLASTGAVANAYFARVDNNGDLLLPAGTQLLAAGPDGLLQFGGESIGTTSSALTVTLENTGGALLHLGTTLGTITGTDAADFALAGDNCGYQLAPGATCTAEVTFKPSVAGARTASLSIPTDAAGSPQIVLLQGNGATATAPTASLSPTTLSFPNTSVGATAVAMSTTLSNTGNAVLNISSITLTGADSADFAETTTCAATLAAGATCKISATFTPAAVASYTASIAVADDATGSPQTATLSGTGVAAPAPAASLSPTTLAFPSTAVGASAKAMSATLSNTGNATLTITGITLGGTNPADFAETTTCGATLAAGGTCTISATFTPAAAGSFMVSVSVADNAAGSPQVATLSGTGNAPPAADFTLTAAPPARTVAPGAVAQFTISSAGVGGEFDNAVQLTATGLPSGFVASFSPTSITPGANGAGSVLSIQTTTQSALAQSHPLRREPSPWVPVSLAALLVIPLTGLRKRFSKLRVLSCLLLVGALAPVLMLTGCSGGYYNLRTQTYTVTVTGTSGSLQHSTTVTLTVQQ